MTIASAFLISGFADLGVTRDSFRHPVEPAYSTALTDDDLQSHRVSNLNMATYRRGSVGEWVSAQLDAVINLPPGWDSYGAQAIDPRLARMVEPAVVELMLNGVPPPSIVPNSDGGLSLEWYRPGVELIIRVPPTWSDADDLPSAYFFDASAGVEWEEELAAAEPRLGDAIQTLVTP